MRPPLNSLKTFSVVADVLSFTQAAQILHVTQGAVSQQIAKLEDLLGVRLFNRQGRQLALTSHGKRLYRGVNSSLQRIDAELDAVVARHSEEVLAITTFGSFAAKWLIPRMRQFESKHPQLRIHMDTQHRFVDLADEGYDLGIRFGSGAWPGLRSEKLFTHRLFPTAWSEFGRAASLASDPERLLSLPLFYDLETPTEWNLWFAEQGLQGESPKLTRGFSDTLVMLSALNSGLEGVALVGEHLTEQELAAGTLVRMSNAYLESEGAFFLVHPQQLSLSASALAFRDWILGEA